MIYKKKIISFFFIFIVLCLYYSFERKNKILGNEYLNIFSDTTNLCNEEKNKCIGFINFTYDFNDLASLERPIVHSNDLIMSSMADRSNMSDSSNIFLEIEQDLYLSRDIDNELYRNEGAFIDVDDDDSFFNRRIDLTVKNNGEFIEVEEYISNRQFIDTNLSTSETKKDDDLDFYLIDKLQVNPVSIGPFIDVDDDLSFVNARK